MKKYSQKKRKKSSLKKYVFAGLFFCILAGLVYLAVWSPYLWVESIEVEDVGDRAVYYSPLDIKDIAWGRIGTMLWQIVPRKSIVLASLGQIRWEILDKYPEIKSADIHRQLPNILRIVIEERENTGVWCQIKQETENNEQQESRSDLSTTTSEEIVESQDQTLEREKEREIGQCFYFDPDGIVFREAPLIRGSLILNVYGIEESVQIGDEIMPSELIEFILAVKQGLPEIKTAFGWSPKAIDFEVVSFEDLRAATDQGWQIYFNPTYSAEAQLESLKMVLDEEIGSDKVLEYLDLRIQGRVYYR